MKNNGIINIIDIHGLKTKYYIVNCITIISSGKSYLIYTKNNDSDSNIIIHVSELIQNEKNTIELKKVISENIMIEIKNILINIINKDKYKENYKLINLDLSKKIIIKGKRSLEIPNKLCKLLKKDYNSNKNDREILNFNKDNTEYLIKDIKIADSNFINKFKESERYINIIKSI